MTALLIIHVIVVVGFMLRILLRNDLTSSARLAWFIVIAIVPYFGVLGYFLFGEIDLGHSADRRHKRIFEEIRAKASAEMGEASATEKLITPFYRSAFSYAGSINGFHPIDGNKAQLMANAADTNKHLIEDIDAASSYVYALYYIWLNDNTGKDIAEAMIRAAKRGVTCHVMVDGLGSRTFTMSALWTQMKEAGVRAVIALPLNKPIRTLLTSRIDLRNHRKITVIDGKITYCGSRNSADPAFLVKAKFAPWVDIMLRFEGPVVAQNELLFLSDWMQETGESLEPRTPKARPITGGFPAQVMGDGPTERRGATPQLFSNLITCAQKVLTLTTPYFVPDTTVFEALCAAAHRGVQVTLIFPKVNDSWIVSAASRSYYHKLLSAGCKIYEFKGGLLHAKTFTMDGLITVVGSSNLDLRSFDLNYENNILLQDAEITAAVQERQNDYMSRSDVVELEQVIAWPYYRRIWNNVIATVGPIL